MLEHSRVDCFPPWKNLAGGSLAESNGEGKRDSNLGKEGALWQRNKLEKGKKKSGGERVISSN